MTGQAWGINSANASQQACPSDGGIIQTESKEGNRQTQRITEEPHPRQDVPGVPRDASEEEDCSAGKDFICDGLSMRGMSWPG